MKRFVPYGIIAVFGLLYGYFVWQSYFCSLPPSYHLSWKGSQWITTPAKGPVGLVRKELFIDKGIGNAWIQISAPDTYDLTVNGKHVVENVFYSSNVSGVHDISTYLIPGKNVIAISNRRLQFPGPGKVVVRGGYSDISGNRTDFFSDSTWKVFDREDNRGSLLWTSPLFEANAWPSALATGEPEAGETYPVAFSPGAITSSLGAKWIRHPSPYPEQAIFRKGFELPDRPLDGWIRISTSSDYDITINGTKVGSGNASATVHLYPVAEVLKGGRNTIEVSAKNPQQKTYALYMDGEVTGRNFALPIFTDGSWEVFLPESTGQIEKPLVIGDYSSFQLSNRQKVRMELSLPFDYQVRRFIAALFTFGLTLFLTYILVAVISKGICRLSRYAFDDCLSLTSFVLVIPALLLIILFIAHYDIRIAQSDIFNPHIVFGILFLVLFLMAILAVLIRVSRGKADEEVSPKPRNSSGVRSVLVATTLVSLIFIGAFLRLNDLGRVSLNGDEISTVRFAHGILERGYPYITIGGIKKPSTTYELLPYPVALSIALFGEEDKNVRLTSAVFGIANIFLIFWVGMKLNNTGTGLLSAAIYTFMPLEINLAQNVRYMVLNQFYGLLSCYLYYRAIEHKEIRRRTVYAASLFFVLGYLTWEGSGYILPSLLIATLLLKGRDFSWIRSWHLWLASVGASVIVLIQIDHRTYWSVPFMMLGSGLSDATFKMMFLTQSYNPWFYVNNFLLTQTHIFLTFLVMIGLPIIITKKELRYLLILFVSILFFFSNTFSLYATRYAYFIQPMLIILGSAVLLRLAEHVSQSVRGFRLPALGGLRRAVPLLVSFMLIAATNDFILKPYRLSENPAPVENPPSLNLRAITEARRDIYPVDFRGANRFVKDNLLDGDLVVTVYTHPTLYYAGKADYFEETIIDTQIIYLDDNDAPRLVNKTVDIPTVTNLATFQRLLSEHKRVWFVASSFDLYEYLNRKDFTSYFATVMKPEYESYRTRVYLWEDGRII
jgi:hypothetical protein